MTTLTLNKAEHIARMLWKNPRRIIKTIKHRIAPKTRKENKRYSTDKEVETLCRYAKNAKLGIVEIGVLDGGTTREFALYAKVPMYGIDPIISDSMNSSLIGAETTIKENLRFYSNYKFFKDFSYNLAPNWKHPFDLIWIDGDHTYDAVKKDFEDWFPLLAKDGYVAFHDSAPVTSVKDAQHQGYEGPIRLVQELKNRSDLKFIETADSITIFQKV